MITHLLSNQHYPISPPTVMAIIHSTLIPPPPLTHSKNAESVLAVIQVLYLQISIPNKSSISTYRIKKDHPFVHYFEVTAH